MAKFDVFALNENRKHLVLDVQADILLDIASRVVIPLLPLDAASDQAAHRFKPILQIDDRSYVLMTADLAAVPKLALKEKIANIEDPYRQAVIDALDFLFQGF